MATWKEAKEIVIRMVQGCIREYHPHLLDARIGILMRDEDGSRSGRPVIGKAQKVNDRIKTLLDLDFIIWFSKETWRRLDQEQRRALVDHELCHCSGSLEEGWKIVGHDLEEFNAVIERHGLWLDDTRRMAKVIQPHLFTLDDHQGKVEPVPLAAAEQTGVLT